jgi:integrase
LILHEVIRPLDNPIKDARLRSQELPAPQGIIPSRDDVHLSSKDMYSLLMNAAQSLIDEKDPTDKKNRKMPYRDAAVIALLYYTRLRADEVCSIEMSQMTRTSRGGIWIRNIQCKGRKVRKAYFKEAGVTIYNNYIKTERGEGDGFVFKSWRGKRLN